MDGRAQNTESKYKHGVVLMWKLGAKQGFYGLTGLSIFSSYSGEATAAAILIVGAVLFNAINNTGSEE